MSVRDEKPLQLRAETSGDHQRRWGGLSIQGERSTGTVGREGVTAQNTPRVVWRVVALGRDAPSPPKLFLESRCD